MFPVPVPEVVGVFVAAVPDGLVFVELWPPPPPPMAFDVAFEVEVVVVVVVAVFVLLVEVVGGVEF